MYNKVILIGTLGKDPFRIKEGMAALSVATNYHKKNNDGSWEKCTDWNDVICFGSQAKFVFQYCKSGDKVLIEGKVRKTSREYDGKTEWNTSIVASAVRGLTGRKDEF